MSTPLGVYIHWPFCKSKCPYCDFNSHVRDGIEQARWRQARGYDVDPDPLPALRAEERERLVCRRGEVSFGAGGKRDGPSISPKTI